MLRTVWRCAPRSASRRNSFRGWRAEQLEARLVLSHAPMPSGDEPGHPATLDTTPVYYAPQNYAWGSSTSSGFAGGSSAAPIANIPENGQFGQDNAQYGASSPDNNHDASLPDHDGNGAPVVADGDGGSAASDPYSVPAQSNIVVVSQPTTSASSSPSGSATAVQESDPRSVVSSGLRSTGTSDGQANISSVPTSQSLGSMQTIGAPQIIVLQPPTSLVTDTIEITVSREIAAPAAVTAHAATVIAAGNATGPAAGVVAIDNPASAAHASQPLAWQQAAAVEARAPSASSGNPLLALQGDAGRPLVEPSFAGPDDATPHSQNAPAAQFDTTSTAHNHDGMRGGVVDAQAANSAAIEMAVIAEQTQSTLLAGAAINFADVDRALQVVLQEIETMGGDLVAWLDDSDSALLAGVGVALLAGGGCYYSRRRSARAGDAAQEEQSTWLFTHLYHST